MIREKVEGVTRAREWELWAEFMHRILYVRAKWKKWMSVVKLKLVGHVWPSIVSFLYVHCIKFDPLNIVCTCSPFVFPLYTTIFSVKWPFLWGTAPHAFPIFSPFLPSYYYSFHYTLLSILFKFGAIFLYYSLFKIMGLLGYLFIKFLVQIPVSKYLMI